MKKGSHDKKLIIVMITSYVDLFVNPSILRWQVNFFVDFGMWADQITLHRAHSINQIFNLVCFTIWTHGITQRTKWTSEFLAWDSLKFPLDWQPYKVYAINRDYFRGNMWIPRIGRLLGSKYFYNNNNNNNKNNNNNI